MELDKQVAVEPSSSNTRRQSKPKKGLTFHRFFTQENRHPFDELEWETRDARITNSKGEVIFEQSGVEVPGDWSMTATNIVASKYFHGQLGTPSREYSVKQLISRVVETITGWGTELGYFQEASDARVFADELTCLLVNQKVAFNSPVWFNVGCEPKPQCSACFINSVEDTMDSILELAKTEGRLFKFGSGTGSNLSSLRSSREKLASGGSASGPVSFMKGYDAFAGVIKSGGKTRRAAKMVILNIDHPDIVDFIQCKVKEERKAQALVHAGYEASLDGEAYSSIFFQNANNSVRVTDDFMRAVENNEPWRTKAITNGEVVHEFQARDLMRLIADSAHVCGDPGIQFDTTINRWNPCKSSGRINASNPCSEYMFLDDSACNLASLNLLRFATEDGQYDAVSFRKAIEVVFTAQEIIVDAASYPTPRIDRNSHEFRPIGLGYANLGALLMFMGLPYDSYQGRDYAATITAIMTGQAYLTSAKIAEQLGPFAHYPKNKTSFLEVMHYHRDALKYIDPQNVSPDLYKQAREVWNQVIQEGEQHGFRNAQATVLAPTGTIGFMMDCDTTGIEPDLALVKYKQLVGGGGIKIVNSTVSAALTRLGYPDEKVRKILNYIEGHGTIEGCPLLKEEHLAIFDCALKPAQGSRTIHHMGHVRMMAAVQPFLSGAISKTVNMPNESTPEDISQTYMEAWKMGLKSIAIYRDGSKQIQPLSTTAETKPAGEEKVVYRPVRKKLPDERRAITHKFAIGGHEGYITVGMYEDGSPGEIFVVMAKEGSVISGVMDGFATAVSMALQYGVPLKVLVEKFTHTRFEPSGFTGNPHIPYAKSLFDYIFKWLALKFLPEEEHQKLGIIPVEEPAAAPAAETKKAARTEPATQKPLLLELQPDAPPCFQCGSIMVRNGACYKCPNCGETSGCS
ncbi:MAG TPA: vitamin B12-dependent ribonucleotide reductase [Acidobacteriota bacterium]|nr:vitamin B12-dependent ribonucleotide reductase [Acidobacteriota bacterium]HQM62679.1 vitamin B12-dependent ribonucleotide reductase [Acidobacteriota bacterium]